MRIPLLLLALGCGSGSPEPTPAPDAPAPAPAAAPAADPAPSGSAGEDDVTLDIEVDKNMDLSGLSDAERRAALMQLGEHVYLTGDGGLACSTCHQKNGKGLPGAFPPLVGQEEWMGDCKNHAGLIINGLQGEVEVDGVKYNGVMAPQGEALNDLQIAAVISYVRESWGNDYGLCSPEDVAAAR